MNVQPTIRQAYAVQSTSPIGSTVIVGTSSIQVAAADTGRRGIIFANPGAVTLWLSAGNLAAVAGQGIPLLPGALMRFIGDGRLINYNSAWNAIAGSGSANPLTVIDLTSSIPSPPSSPTGGLSDDAGNQPLDDALGNVLFDANGN